MKIKSLNLLLDSSRSQNELQRSARLFDSLSLAKLQELLPLFELDEFQDGDDILIEGKPAEKVFFLLQGKVEVISGTKRIFMLRRRGDIFGETSILAKEPCEVGIRAVDRVRMLSIKGLELGSAMHCEEQELSDILQYLFTIALSTKLAASLDMAEELKRAERRMEKTEQTKTTLLELLNHELRTPLNGIVGMTQVLLLSELSDEQMDHCTSIIESSNSLTSILNDILNASRLDQGFFEPRQILFHLDGVVHKLVNLFGAAAKAKGLELTSNLESDLGNLRMGDAGLLEQVLINLVSNAVKFTDKGSVKIDVCRTKNDQGNQVVRFEVSDTGIGVDPELQKEIFQPFTQADQGTTRKYEGLGLGLTLSARFAALLGTQIQVDKSDDEGSRFWFEVDLPSA